MNETRASTLAATPATEPPTPPRPRARGRLGRIILWPLALLVLGLVVAIGLRIARGDRTLGEVKLKPYTAPDFALTQFDGDRFSLGDQRGKVVVVNFWASWCVPCKTETPILQSASERYRDRGVVFVGVDIKDTPDDARTFLQRYAVTYPNGFDAKKNIYIDYGVYGLPETFVIDRQGKVIHHVIGPTTRSELDGWLLPLAGPGEPSS